MNGKNILTFGGIAAAAGLLYFYLKSSYQCEAQTEGSSLTLTRQILQ